MDKKQYQIFKYQIKNFHSLEEKKVFTVNEMSEFQYCDNHII